MMIFDEMACTKLQDDLAVALDAAWKGYYSIWFLCPGAWDTLDELEALLSKTTGLTEQEISQRGAHYVKKFGRRGETKTEREKIRDQLAAARARIEELEAEINSHEMNSIESREIVGDLRIEIDTLKSKLTERVE